MDISQRNHLLGRLKDAAEKKEWGGWRKGQTPAFSEPATVVRTRNTIKRLQRVVDAFEKKRTTRNDAHNNRVKKAKFRVHEIILFGDPVAALKAVKEFEGREIK